MKKASLIGFVIFFVMTSQAICKGWVPESIEISPANPTPADVVAITFSGEWDDSCVPNGSSISVVGNDIYFGVVVNYPPAVICTTEITPWERTEHVGPLTAGTYSVYASLDGGAYTLVEDFTVGRPTIYVDADATGADDGSCWADAFSCLQDALTPITPLNSEIRVAQGVYKPDQGVGITPGSRQATFHLINSVSIKGGYAGYGEPDPDARDVEAYETILSGAIGGSSDTDNSRQVVTGADNAIIDGFIITDGYTADWTSPLYKTYGAGMYNYTDSNLAVINCTFSYNCARFGGAMYNVYSEVRLTNCLFYYNSSGYDGGALREVEGTSILTNCTFYNNQADTFREGYCGGGMGIHDSNSTLLNCIFRSNSDNSGMDESAQIHSEAGTLIVNYSCIQNLTGGLGGLGNIDVDPCFADSRDGDFHLKSEAGRWDPNSGSWVQDAVTSSYIDAGNPGCRLSDEPNDTNNVRINMGAYGGTATASKTPANWRSIADLTNDWVVDYDDLAAFVEYWPDSGPCLPSDLDRNGSIDFSDLAEFGESWRWEE